MEDWITTNGITFSKFEISTTKTETFSCIAKEDIPVDSIIASIPKESILSTRTCSISHLFHSEKFAENHIDGPLALTVALFYERSMGKNSRWFGYLSALPEYEPLPLYWFSKVAKGHGVKRTKVVACKEAIEYLKCLENTEIADLKADYSLMYEDFVELVVPFFELHADRLDPACKPIKFLDFLYCSTIVASRSFEVDEHHGFSLVPLADLFNHSSNEHVHLESDEDVAESDTIEFRAVRECTSGEEIFNTYGKHSNTYLLMKYGFCEQKNPFDVISFSMADVVTAVEKSTAGDVEERTAWWLEHGYHIANDAEQPEEDQGGDHEEGEEVEEDECGGGEVVDDEGGEDGDSHGEDHDEDEEADEVGQDDEIEDYFQVDSNGPSSKFRLFLHLLLRLSPEDFERWNESADYACKGMREFLANETGLSGEAKVVVGDLAGERLGRYPDLQPVGEGSGSLYPRMLRDIEIASLNKLKNS
jgi:hypothetical protein